MNSEIARRRWLTEGNELVEALGFEREHEAFRHGIQIRALRRQLEALGARGSEDRAKRRGEQRVAVMNQVALAAQEPVDAVGQVARDLLNPRVVRIADQTGDVHAARLEVDDEPDNVADETAERENLDGEEVGRGDHAEVRLEEGLPRHRSAALGRGLQAILGEDALDRVSSQLVTKVAERTADPGVAPGRVLGGKADDQALQRGGCARSAGAAPGAAV